MQVAGFSVRGRVVRAGAGLTGALVTLVGTQHTAITAQDGSYTLLNVKRGTYTVSVTAGEG